MKFEEILPLLREGIKVTNALSTQLGYFYELSFLWLKYGDIPDDFPKIMSISKCKIDENKKLFSYPSPFRKETIEKMNYIELMEIERLYLMANQNIQPMELMRDDWEILE